MQNNSTCFLNLKIEKIILAARNNGKNGHRDATMILIMYRCALNLKELLFLRWRQIDTKLGLLYTENLSKNIFVPIYPLFESELKILRKIQQQNPDSQYVFVSKNQTPLAASTFRRIIKSAFIKANIPMNSNILNRYGKKHLIVGDDYIN